MEGRVNERGKRKSASKALGRSLGRAQMKNKKRGVFAKVAERFRAVFSDNELTDKAQSVGAYSAVFMAAFLVALVSASAFTPVDNTEAARTEVNLNASNYELVVASAESAQMNLAATADGAMAVAKDSITVTTNSPGYRVYLSMNSSTSGTNKLVNDTDDNYYFSSSTGDVSDPITLNNNTWGWALADPSSDPDSTIKTYGFSEVYCPTVGTCSDGSTSTGVDVTNTFAGMPLVGNEALVAASTSSTTSSPGGSDHFDIYYGAKANTALTSGIYTGTVVYTAVADASTSHGGAASVYPESQTDLTTDTTITVSTSFYASSSLIANLTSDDLSVRIGGKTCLNPSPALSNAGTLNITCTSPDMTAWGTYDVVATIPKFDAVYTVEDGYSYYVPYSTIKTAPAGTYTMQQFTKKACEEAPTPKAYNTQDGTGSILNGDTINTDVPEVTLKDARNTSHEYRVRKLADGNCWMADNLRLTLSTSTPLTSETSDINYDMDTGKGWDGSTTTPRVISNNLQGTVDPLGTYSTNSSTGVISWTPFADSQTASDGYIAWSSSYTDASGTMATSGESIAANIKHFGLDGKTEVTEGATYYVNEYTEYTEYARSYDDGTNTLIDDDGNTQYRGTYYNWHAATAGSGTYAMVSGDAPNSVCPRGWHIPKAYNSGSWRNLLYVKYAFTATGSRTGVSTETSALQKIPFSVAKTGHYKGLRGRIETGSGFYWTSSIRGSQTYQADDLLFSGAYFDPAAGYGKGAGGLTVRCVVR